MNANKAAASVSGESSLVNALVEAADELATLVLRGSGGANAAALKVARVLDDMKRQLASTKKLSKI